MDGWLFCNPGFPCGIAPPPPGATKSAAPPGLGHGSIENSPLPGQIYMNWESGLIRERGRG